MGVLRREWDTLEVRTMSYFIDKQYLKDQEIVHTAAI